MNVFYQTEGLREINFLEISHEQSVAVVKELIIGRHGLETETLIFIEDGDGPEVKLHVHRCRHIKVSVAFAGKTIEHEFTPGNTVARVKRWATEKFGMTPDDASEHLLQIAGTHDRPSAGAHLGSLTTRPSCHIAFDLLPDQRVNG